MKPCEIRVPAAQPSQDELVLSTPTLADVDALTAACQDAEIQRWTTVPSPYTADDATAFVLDVVAPGWEAGRDLTWAIRDAGQGGDQAASTTADQASLLGVIDLLVRPDGRGTVGYWLAPEARGKGIMHRALSAVIDTAFDPAGPLGALHLTALRWECAVEEGIPNWASWRVAWRLGFVKEGLQRASRPRNRGGQAHLTDGWTATLLASDPRQPRAPWDGPTPASPEPTGRGNGSAHTSGDHTPLVALDSIGRREGDDPEALVRRFHRVYGLPIRTDGPSLERESLHMRTGLIAEEFAELTGAVYGAAARAEIEKAWARARELDDATRDTVEAADALADLVYVIYGMALETGIDLAAVLAEVQRSNMSKLGEDGKPIYRADGKVLKGPGYFRPDVAGVLGLGDAATSGEMDG